MKELKKHHVSEMASERDKFAEEVQKREKLQKIQKVLELEHQENLKTMEKQKEMLKPLNEELAAVRRAKQELEAQCLVLDKLNTDLNNKSIEICRTINLGKDAGGHYIQRTKRLVKQAMELRVKTSLLPKVTKKIEKTIEARDEANFEMARLHKEVERLSYENENFAAREKGRREADQRTIQSLQKRNTDLVQEVKIVKDKYEFREEQLQHYLYNKVNEYESVSFEEP